MVLKDLFGPDLLRSSGNSVGFGLLGFCLDFEAHIAAPLARSAGFVELLALRAPGVYK